MIKTELCLEISEHALIQFKRATMAKFAFIFFCCETCESSSHIIWYPFLLTVVTFNAKMGFGKFEL